MNYRADTKAALYYGKNPVTCCYVGADLGLPVHAVPPALATLRGYGEERKGRTALSSAAAGYPSPLGYYGAQESLLQEWVDATYLF